MDPNQPIASEETLAVMPPSSTPPGRRNSRWAWVLLAVFVLLSGVAYGAVQLFGNSGGSNNSPKATGSPAPSLSSTEQGKLKDVSTGPTLLQVTQLVSENSSLGAALATSLQVSGAVSLQTNLAVTGSGTFGGTVTAANFQGGGAGLTGVDAALLNGQPGSFYAGLANNVTNLSANAALRNAPNTFTASNTFNGSVTISGPTSLTGTTTISSLILSTPLTVDQGGTGLTSVPVGGILYGQGGPTLGVATPASAGQCLVSTSTAVQWGSCSGSAGGVDSVNGLTGALTLNDTTGSGTSLTINDASTSSKGIASFNATNFSVVSGAVNTIQNISTTSTPSFAGLSLGSPLSVASGGTGASALTSNGVVIGQGTGALTTVAAGSAGECLVSTAGAPTFQSCPGAAGVLSVNSQTGAVAIANATGSGGVITIDDATTGSKGIASFNSTNFTATGGAVNTVQDIGTTASPTFAALTLSGTLNANVITPNATATIGATGQNITLQGATTTITSTNGANTAALSFAAPSSNVTYVLQTAAAGTYDVCTTAGNCTGLGGTVTSPGGTTNALAKFTGSTTLGNSILTDDGSMVTIGGNLEVTGGVTLDSPLSVPSGGTGAASLTANGVVIGQGLAALTVVTATGAGECLVSTAGAPTFQSCPGATGVSSVNGQGGAVSIANATGSGGVVTIDNASTGAKGIASFNSTNFTVTSGAVDTIQDIGTTANPIFANTTLSKLTVTSSQATSPLIFANNTNGSGTGNLIDLQQASTSLFSVSSTGDVNAAGSLAAGAATFSSVTTNTITPTAAATYGSTSQDLTLQGAATAITSTNAGKTTTLSFVGPTADVTYRLQTTTAGTYDICTTAGNCTGTGGGVTSPGGTLNHLARFSAGTTIVDSIITDDGSTVTVGGTLAVNTITPTAALTIGSASQNTTVQGATVALKANASGIANTLTFATPTGSNKTITIPDASGTVAVSASGPLALDAAGNLTCPTCLTSGGGGGTAGVTSVNGATGSLTIQGASAGSLSTVGTTITVNDASASLKGLASFNSTNFSVTSGAVNTIQDISTTSSPTFGNLTITNALTAAGTNFSVATAGDLTFGNNADKTIGLATAASGSNGNNLTVKAGNGNGTNKNGGDLVLSGGAATGTGLGGAVIVKPQTDSTMAFAVQSAASANVLTVDTVNSQVGINTATPGATFDMVGEVFRMGPTQYPVNLPFPGSTYLVMDKNNTASDTSVVMRDAGAIRAEIGLVTDDNIHFKTATGPAGSETFTDRLIIDTAGDTYTTGKLGVGTVPTEQLHVAATNTTAKVLAKIENTNTGAGSHGTGLELSGGAGIDWTIGSDVGLNGGNNFAIQDNSFGYQPRLMIDSSGRIGLGTDSPNASLSFAAGADRTIDIIPSSGTAAGNNLTIAAGNGNGTNQNGGNLLLQGGNSTGTGTPGTVIVQSQTDSATAFQIQKASGAVVLNADTTTGNITLGAASSVTGQLTFANSGNAFGVTIAAGTTATGYSITLPTNVGTTGQCLAVTGVVSGNETLGYSTCFGVSLQGAYTASTGGTTPEIKVDSTRLGVDIQDANTTIGTSQNLLAVRASNSGGLGSLLFGVTTQGYVSLQPTANSTSMFNIKNASGGNALTFDSTNGQLGINLGSSNVPAYALDVNAGASNDGLRISTSNSVADLFDIQGPSYSYYDIDNNGHVHIRPRTDGVGVVDVRDSSNTFSIFSVDTGNGRVGINASVPGAGLDVNPSGAGEIALTVTGKTSQTADLLQVQTSTSAKLLTVGATGVSTFKNSTNSTAAFLIENSTGTPLFTADTTDNEIDLGTNTGLYLNGSAAYISNNQGLTGSEAFGAGATVGSTFALAVGASSSAANGGVAVGNSATNTSSNSTAVGEGATSGYAAVAVGTASTADQAGVAVGISATNDGAHNSIALGAYSTNTDDQQLVIGGSTSDGSYIQDAYLGSGVTDVTPQSITIHATGGSGANVAGASLSLAGGQGTGTGNGGGINLQVAKPGTTGSSLNTLTTVASLSGTNGSALFKNAADSTSAFTIQNSGGTPLLTADTSGMKITVASLVVSANLTVNGHIISGGTAPTIAAGTAACTTPTVSVAGTDTAGLITVTTGTSCSAGKLATVTFHTAFGAAPRVTLTPAETHAAALSGVYVDSATIGTTTFDIDTNNAATASTTYKWYYHVIQ